MRLAHKLSLAQIVLICAILLLHAEIRLHREIHLFESDMRRDQHVTGRAVSAALAEIWRGYGPARALHLIQDANSAEKSVSIGWIWLDLPGKAAPLAGVGGNLREELLSGREVVRVERDGQGPGRLATYVPVRIPDAAPGAIQISESLLEERQFIQATVLHMAGTTTILALGAALISVLLGSSIIERPMRRLILQARRIGAGHLSERVDFRQKDEIGALALEMNQMCNQLEEADCRLAAETEARIAALEQLRHADRLATVGTLSSGIAHELGTPLNIVSGRAKMIETGSAVGREAADNARIIREQVERMVRIIRQVLDFSRQGRRETALEDLRPILRRALNLLRHQAERNSAWLELVEDGSEPALVLMDARQIEQVVINLILNGIQAMPRGGKLAVEIHRRRVRPPIDPGGPEGEFFCLQVEDEGIGIPQESLGRVFDPFYTTKGVGEGTGLGLSVSYGIVREHGGWIEVESEVQRGSRFLVYLPAMEASCVPES